MEATLLVFLVVYFNFYLKKYISVEESPDVYRSLLGPTPDETILAGLQTVIDMCGILETPNQIVQTSGSSEAESLIHYVCIGNNPKISLT